MKYYLSAPSRRRGAALILVLGALILISVIVIGFLLTVRQDRASSNAYQSGASARQYADTAVNIAIAQIADATSDPNLAWISQPGLLRTFDSSGVPVAAYKLYSSPVMKVTGVYNPESNLSAEVPDDWFSRANAVDQFVDLNRPISVLPSGSTSPRLFYPIADPTSTSAVEGFSLDTISQKPAASNANFNDLPMPVSWIYVLKNGKLVNYATALTSDDVVARIAFWGDDETCKVNINTASDGVYYDSPVAHTQEDHKLARYQPIAQEYQRYPGHPASTSIASIFKELRDESSDSIRSQKASAITPRIGWGGSQGSTIQAWSTRNLGVLDSDRLFSGVDELTYGRDSSGAWASSGASPLRNFASLTIDTTRLPFFLTTDSRGPELNIFNRPRITLWPFNKELVDATTGDSQAVQKLTPEDRLIRFASEVGSNKRKLYFQRDDAWNPTNDWDNIAENQNLYHYLQWLTQQSIPANSSRTGGTGSTLENKFTALGRDQILTEMVDYLRSLVNTTNRSYEPVGGPVYSFPQGHDLNNTGFNDRCPLLIDAGNGTTKGLGSGGITLTEFIMQFYNATNTLDATSNVSEKVVDLIDNTTGATGADGKADYMIRRVQLVILLDFWMTINNLQSAMPRFQVELQAPHLFINPNPDGLPIDLTNRVYVRNWVNGQADDAGWTTDSIDLGLPASSVNIYCSNDAQFDTGGNNIFGGSLGMAYGFRYRGDGRAFSGFLSKDVTNKTLDPAATANYTKYPFVSQFIEFRIPVKLSGTTAALDPVTNKPVPKLGDTVIVGLEGVPTASGPLNGSPATVTVYPGLLKPATPASLSNPGYLGNLQPRTASTYLQKVDLTISNCKFPLPRLGPDTVLTGSWQVGVSPQYKYSQLSDYSKRLEYYKIFPSDMMFLVPNGDEGQSNWVPNGKQTMVPMDSFRSYAITSDIGSRGDFRLAALKRNPTAIWYQPNTAYASDPQSYMGMNYLPTFLSRGYGATALGRSIQIDSTINSPSLWPNILPKVSRLVTNATYGITPDARTAGMGLNGASKKNGSDGDYTNGYGSKGDGGMIKGPDIGAVTTDPNALNTTAGSPYFAGSLSRSGTSDSTATSDTYHLNFTGLVYSPWKQIPSAVRFGTLPSRALDGDPWETLLFNPNPAGGKANHRGWNDKPRDHFWLDLFYMPVVEPYAITENFATNGKINLNQQIAPFTYIRRNTGLYALLRNMKVLAIPAADAASYKSATVTMSNSGTQNYRKPIDLGTTVTQIQDRLKLNNDPFIAASEICEIPMLFDGRTAANIDTYWDGFKLTGDDSREAPYNALYPRVTTRSNTYRIHFIAQTLKGKGGAWAVAGQYRGSQIVERYLDGFSGVTASRVYGNGSQPSTQFPALAGNDANGVPYYRFRKIGHQQFSP